MFYEPIYLDIDLSSFQPKIRQTRNHSFKRKNCHPEQCKPKNFRLDCLKPRCHPSNSQEPTSLYVALPEFKPENIQVKISKSGRVDINASKENTVDTERNGQRKTTVHTDFSFDLPEYLVKENMLNEVKTEFDHGKLVFKFPKKPIGVKMAINFEDGGNENGEKGKNSEVVKGMVEDIEDKNEKDTVDFEIVKMVDADGNSEIDVE